MVFMHLFKSEKIKGKTSAQILKSQSVFGPLSHADESESKLSEVATGRVCHIMIIREQRCAVSVETKLIRVKFSDI